MASKTLIVQHIETDSCSAGKFLIYFYYNTMYGTAVGCRRYVPVPFGRHAATILVPGEDFVGFIELCIEFFIPREDGSRPNLCSRGIFGEFPGNSPEICN